MLYIYKEPYWWAKKYDARKKMFRGLSKEAFEKSRQKHYARQFNKAETYLPSYNKVDVYLMTMEMFATIPYVYQGDGFDDFNNYQRPSVTVIDDEGGTRIKGWVAVCPGERGNNIYVDEPHAVKSLYKKYLQWRRTKK